MSKPSLSFSSTASRLINRLLSVGADPTDPPNVRQRKRLMVGVIWGIVFFDLFALPFGAALGAGQLAALLSLTIFVFLGILAAIQLRPALFSLCLHVLCLYVLLNILGSTLLFGGIVTGIAVLIVGLLTPILALLMLGARAGIFWFGAFMITIIAVAILSNWVPARYLFEVPDLFRTYLPAANLTLVGVIIFLTLMYFIRQRDEFQTKSDNLLLNILPGEIAERLKEGEETIADSYESASIMFVDLVNFTPLSAASTPKEMVILLSQIFSHIDELVEEYKAEKIETIGDSYMVAAGLPVLRQDHAHVIANLALAIQAYFASGVMIHGQPINCRIGINSGPLMAGVIGRKKISYHVWGDTVNTASRMESHGIPGQIQISESTHAF